MSRLQPLQSQFQEAVLDGNSEFENSIVSTERVDAKQRIAIYAEAYRLRLIECLQENYAALHHLLGDEQFDGLCRAYIESHTPHHYSIRWYGDHLAEFLHDNAPYSQHPFLAELAEFEWKLMAAFDAADVPVAAAEDLAGVPADRWPGLRFELHPSLQRLQLAWNVVVLWKASEEKRDPETPAGTDAAVPWIIWRRDLRQRFRSLDQSEAWALDRAQQGEDFAALCEGLRRWKSPQEVATYAASLMKRWLNDGLITRIEF